MCAMFLVWLLLLCGDIETNPGFSPTAQSLPCASSDRRPPSLSSHLSCSLMNARSIVNKILDLNVFLVTVKPDVVAITESFLDGSILDSEVVDDSFLIFRKDRNRHGGGVMILVRRGIPAVCRDDLMNMDKESEVIWIELLVKPRTILFGVFYRPPGSGVSKFRLSS